MRSVATTFDNPNCISAEMRTMNTDTRDATLCFTTSEDALEDHRLTVDATVKVLIATKGPTTRLCVLGRYMQHGKASVHYNIIMLLDGACLLKPVKVSTCGAIALSRRLSRTSFPSALFSFETFASSGCSFALKRHGTTCYTM